MKAMEAVTKDNDHINPRKCEFNIEQAGKIGCMIKDAKIRSACCMVTQCGKGGVYVMGNLYTKTQSPFSKIVDEKHPETSVIVMVDTLAEITKLFL